MQSIQDSSVNVADLPHAASAFVGRSDRADVSAFATRGRSSALNSTVCLDDISTDESLSKLDPNCLAMVRNLITNHQYKYIVNDISVAQALTDVHELTYVVKVQQPRGDWEKIYHRAESAFEVLSEYYSLEPHCRGHFKTRNCGIAIGPGSLAPHLLSESEAESEIHAEFIHEVEQYVRHFTVSARLWMPNLMKQYTDLQVELIAINCLFRVVFPDSPFCTFTMNMGP
ncbi:hypothetical protein PILCRDRAFT_4693 [Piloderma croceum F 1598]|uniref:Uncharacterized protein n=1 Tax=Piloderma croceum (strain F 1598) TaxID=765440 RepID=A0A0C3G4R0_PILCF|nr:hypothetical protein PILCRDRAFT_4693 [Piloderma croceum F 1598]